LTNPDKKNFIFGKPSRAKIATKIGKIKRRSVEPMSNIP